MCLGRPGPDPAKRMSSNRSFVKKYHFDKDCPILLEYHCDHRPQYAGLTCPVAHDNAPCAAVGLLYYGVGNGLKKPRRERAKPPARAASLWRPRAINVLSTNEALVAEHLSPVFTRQSAPSGKLVEMDHLRYSNFSAPHRSLGRPDGGGILDVLDHENSSLISQ